MLRAVIVDDEAVARRLLASLLEDEPDVKVVGQSAGGHEAVTAIGRLQPDVVFLDVRMPGLDGFQVLEKLPPERRPHVIFVTAHDEYAVEAFRVRAFDYLLKPFDEERLRQSLQRVRERLGATGPDGAGPAGSRRLAVKQGEDTFLLGLDEVDWIESMANYVRVHTAAGAYLTRGTLKSLEARLDPRRFARIHRGTIVNLDRVDRLSALGHGDQVVILKNGKHLTASRRYRDRLERLLDKI